GHIRNGNSQPPLDNYVQESAKYTILKYKPNLMLIHFTDVDAHRHYYGYNSVEANEALKRHDIRLGEIIDTLKKANILEDSTIIALGDHSTIDGNNMINVNVLLKENGLLEVDSKGKLKSYKAIAKSCDGSSYIYLKNRNDKEILNLISTILN
ncbi:alkaline phosphatase family protein, partial [Clostridium perfringens]